MPRITSLSSKLLSITSKFKSLNPFKLKKIILGPTGSSSLFSRAISFDGRYALSTDINNPSRVYVFDTELNATTPIAVFYNPDSYTSSFDNFAATGILVKNGYVWVSAAAEDVVENGNLRSNIGVVYRWSLNDINNYTMYTLPSIATQRNQAGFGVAIAQNSSFTLISSSERNFNGQNNMGAVYVYDNNMNLIRRIAPVNNFIDPGLIGLGRTIQLNDNNIALFGATNEKVYLYNVSSGVLLNTFENPNAYGTPEEDRFGLNFAISNTHCVITAFDENDGIKKGVVYVYRLSDYSLISTIINPNIRMNDGLNDDFARSIAITDSYIYVGAPYESNQDNTVTNKGLIYVFSLDGALVGTLNNPLKTGTSNTLFALEQIIIRDNKLITTMQSPPRSLIFDIDESLF
jgi:hypothetical protein